MLLEDYFLVRWLQALLTVITAPTFTLSRARTVGGPLKVSFDQPIKKLHLLAEDAQWVSVLLPGWGQARVLRSDAVIQRQPATGAGLEWKRRPLRHLIIEDDKDCLPVLLELLREVGTATTTIEIWWTERRTPSQHWWIRDACRARSSLEVIRLNANSSSSFMILAKCYEEGECTAKHLAFGIIQGDPELEEIFLFLDSITDENLALGHHLRNWKLSIRLSPRRFAQLVMTTAKLLKQNVWLWNFDMSVRLYDQFAGDGHCVEFESLVTRFDGQGVAIRSSPLPIASKVAFLSVLRDAEEHGHIDALATGRIFEFAANGKMSRVRMVVQRVSAPTIARAIGYLRV